MPSCLVFRVNLFAEVFCLHVKGDRTVIGAKCFDLAEQNVDHAENGIGIFPALGRQRTNAVKGAVENTVAVYDQNIFHAAFSVSVMLMLSSFIPL